MRRQPVLAIAAICLLALVACGGDDSATPTTTFPPLDSVSGTDGFQYATGADDVVIKIEHTGGFVPATFEFTRTPDLLVTGDGQVFTPAMTTLEYPGRLVVPPFVQQLDPEGMQALLAHADEAGLLATPPVYATNDMIADAPNTVVTFEVDGQTFVHSAYALGLDEETDPARQRLAEFVADATTLTAVVPEGSLSEATQFVPAAYEIQATPADPAGVDAATEVEWLSDTGIALAAAAECVEVPERDVAATATLLDADQATFFVEDGVTYQLAVRPQLPGGPAC